MNPEKLYKRWKSVLLFFLIAFMLFQGWQDIQNIVTRFGFYVLEAPTFIDRMGLLATPRTTGNTIFTVLGLVVLALFLAAVTLWIVHRVWISRHPDLKAVIGDERIARNWMRSFRFSYLSLLAAVLLDHAIGFVFDIVMNVQRPTGPTWYGEFWIHLLPSRYLLIAVTTLLASFLIFDRERDHG